MPGRRFQTGFVSARSVRHLLGASAAILSLASAACTGGQSHVEASLSSSVMTTQPNSTAPSPSSTVVGETLAFLRGGDVWLVGADGVRARRLGLKGVSSFVWITRTELDVVVGAGRPTHFLVDLEGHRVRLPFPPGGSWSRDGLRYTVPIHQQIAVFDRAGAVVVRLDVGPTTDRCANPPAGPKERLRFGTPVFAPDGQRVLVAVGCLLEAGAYNQPARIYEASLDGKANRPLGELRTNLRERSAPLLSPDDRHVAQSDSGGLSICPSGRTLTVATARGGGIRQLAPDARDSLDPSLDYLGGLTGYDWSPASDRLVAGFQILSCNLVSGRFEPVLNGLYVLPLAGHSEERLTKAPAADPAWSPSGLFIAWVKGAVFGGLPTFTVHVINLPSRRSIDLGVGSHPAWQPTA
jgi:hypothetical protein